MNAGRLLTVVAVGVATVGLAAAFVPGLAAAVPSSGSTALAAVAVLAGLVRTWSWFGHETEATEPPSPESPASPRVPGDGFDRSLAAVPSIGGSAGDQRALHVRDELREIAVAVLVRYRGYSESEAYERLRSGAWTTDRKAAEFFSSVDGTGSSLGESVAGTLWDEEGPFRRRARRAIAAVHGIVRGGE